MNLGIILSFNLILAMIINTLNSSPVSPDTPASFINLLNSVNQCNFVSVRSYTQETCTPSYDETFCNKFLKTIQQIHGSTLVSYKANHVKSLANTSLGALSLERQSYFTKCTIWIQYDIVYVPFELTKLQPTLFIFYAELDYPYYSLFIPLEYTVATWLFAIYPFFHSPMVILQVSPVTEQQWILCFYCDRQRLVKYPLININLKIPLVSHEIKVKNLYGHPIVFREIGENGLLEMESFKSKNCMEYSKQSNTSESFCVMRELSARNNFTISMSKIFFWDPEISSRVMVNQYNLHRTKSWLSHYTFGTGFGFMSASLNTNITVSNVYIDPLTLSSWLVVLFILAFVSVLLTVTNLFRKTSKYFVIRLLNNIFLLLKNLVDQPTSCSDTNGMKLKMGTLILCLWCFCCLNANYAYKAAVFSGAHFQDNNGFPTNLRELLNSQWVKVTSNRVMDTGYMTSNCVLKILHGDNELIKGTLCNPMSLIDVVSYLKEWSSSLNFPLNGSSFTKSRSIILVDSMLRLTLVETASNALEVNLQRSKVRQIPQLLFTSFWGVSERGPIVHLIDEGLQQLEESGLQGYWERMEFFTAQSIQLNYFNNYKLADSTDRKYEKVENTVSYLISGLFGRKTFTEFKPIPMSVYLKGIQYVSVFLAISLIIFIVECILGNEFFPTGIQRIWCKLSVCSKITIQSEFASYPCFRYGFVVTCSKFGRSKNIIYDFLNKVWSHFKVTVRFYLSTFINKFGHIFSTTCN